MNILEELFKNLVFPNTEWIQVSDSNSNLTIEDFPYETGVVDSGSNKHCVKCIAVNNCYFKNENSKKPKLFHYTLDIIRFLLKKLGLDLQLGIYHPFCHCKEIGIITPNEKTIHFIIPDGKIDWMIKDKGHLLKQIGYKETEFYEAVSIIKKLVATEFIKGNYSVRAHDNMGFRIGLVINFPGKNEDIGKNYKLKTGWSIFPNGKLKYNTLIGGLEK